MNKKSEVMANAKLTINNLITEERSINSRARKQYNKALKNGGSKAMDRANKLFNKSKEINAKWNGMIADLGIDKRVFNL